MKSLIVRSRLIPKYLAWPSLAYLVFVAAYCASLGVWPACAVMLFVIALYIYEMSPCTTLEADSELIRYSTPLSCWEVKWSEVTQIETSHSGATVLYGHKKTLVLPSASMWQQEGKEQMLEFIQAQARAWDISQQRTLRAAFQSSMNTRISLFKRPKPPLSL